MTVTNSGRRRFFPFPARTRRRVLVAVLLAVDALALTAAFWLAYLLRFEILPYTAFYTLGDYALLVGAFVPAWLVVFAVFQLYNPHTLFGGIQEYARVFNAVSLGIVALVVVGFFLRDAAFTISRGWLILSWLFTLLLAEGARFGLRRVVYALRRRGHLLSPALIVGANEEGRALAQQLDNWATSGLYVVGFVDGEALPAGAVLGAHPVLGSLDDLERLVPEKRIAEIIVAPTALTREQLLSIFRAFGVNSDVEVRLSSGLFEVMTTGLQVKELAYVPLISVSKARMTGGDAALKAMLDYGLTVPGLVFLSPLLLLVALAVKLDSPGPVIYRRRVMGVGGREFDAFKFRTMRVDGDEILAARPELKAALTSNHKLKDDPRVTRVGKVLRRFSIDELPQLFNVLRGEMSLVGPRMISPPEMAEYGKWGMNLLTVKPGLTGLWQVSGRADVSYEERVRLDMHYIRNWTIWLDLQLLMRTIPVVLGSRGAY
ncbi:MAG: sugar transferase [Anaerolineae bacterium]|nr:sugar transferase [Anaerolineae bacterium]